MNRLICVNARFLTQEITGVQRFAIEISKVLKNSDLNITFLSPGIDVKHPELLKELEVIQIGSSSGYYWEQVELPRYLKKNNSPLLINLMSTAPIFYSNKLYTLHDITFIRFPKNFSWKFRNVYKILIPLMLRTSKRILTVSRFSKEEISGYYKIDNRLISIVHNGVEPKKHREVNYSIVGEYFLTVSSPSENKNLIRLIQAFNNANLEGIKLVIVGGIDTYRFSQVGFLDQVKDNDKIIFTGRLDDNDLDDLYSQAKGFVFPSVYEGFGIPPLEAQSFDCPVLLSDIEVFKDLYGDSVLYCNPYSVEDISQKLEELDKDSELRKELIIKGQGNLKKYTWKNSVESIKKVLAEVYE